MKKSVKLLLIICVIISFSCGLTDILAMFMPGTNPIFYLFMSLISFTISHIINEEIISKEEPEIEEI